MHSCRGGGEMILPDVHDTQQSYIHVVKVSTGQMLPAGNHFLGVTSIPDD